VYQRPDSAPTLAIASERRLTGQLGHGSGVGIGIGSSLSRGEIPAMARRVPTVPVVGGRPVGLASLGEAVAARAARRLQGPVFTFSEDKGAQAQPQGSPNPDTLALSFRS
jgi:hypothetical protein